MTHSHGPTTSTRSVPKCSATSIFFAVSLGFFLSLFFSSLNLTFSLSLTTATLSSPGVPRLRHPGWRPSSTMPTALPFVNVESSALAACTELVFPPWLPEETSPCSYHVQLYVFKVPSLSISAFSFALIPLQHLLCFVFPAQTST